MRKRNGRSINGWCLIPHTRLCPPAKLEKQLRDFTVSTPVIEYAETNGKEREDEGKKEAFVSLRCFFFGWVFGFWVLVLWSRIRK